MLVTLHKRPSSVGMGFSLSTITGALNTVAHGAESVGQIGYDVAAKTTQQTANLVGSIGHSIVGTAGNLGIQATGVVATTTEQLGGAIQAVRPQAGYAPPAAPGLLGSLGGNLPLLLGAGAAAVVLVLLLTGKKKAPAPAAVAA